MIVFAVLNTQMSKWLIILLATLDGVGGGLAQTALFGISAYLPPKYMSATMTGQGVSGVFTTVVYFSIQGIYAALRAADNNGTLTVVDNSTATLEAIAEAAAVLYYFGSALSFLCVILVLALPRMPFYNYYYNKANRETKAAKKDLLDDGLGEDRRLADEALPTTSCGKLSFIFKRLWVSALSVFYVLYVAVAVYPGIQVMLSLVL
jgi:hypothetical protein